MMFFRPAIFDESELVTLTSSQEFIACYWLVSNPNTAVRHGKPLTHSELEKLIKNQTQ